MTKGGIKGKLDAAMLVIFCEKGCHRSVSVGDMVVEILKALLFSIRYTNLCDEYVKTQRCMNPHNPRNKHEGNRVCPDCIDNPISSTLLNKAVDEFFEVALAIDTVVADQVIGERVGQVIDQAQTDAWSVADAPSAPSASAPSASGSSSIIGRLLENARNSQESRYSAWPLNVEKSNKQQQP